MDYTNHLTKWEDLVTPYESTRAGFIAIAFEKNIKATPFVEEAKSLRVLIKDVKKPNELLNLKDIYPSLLTAAGLSEKSLNHLTENDKKEAINNLIEKFIEPAGKNFIDELIYRFLLTRGDSLGGMMRNIAGAIAQKKLIRCILSALSIKHRNFKYLHSITKKWIDGDIKDTSIEENTGGLYWNNDGNSRTLLFNITPPIVDKNVDMCIFSCKYENFSKKIINDASKYIALGELKGGIDPAGADEHWKTANTALERIRSAFILSGSNPMTFFIGAAIENSMAQEIVKQLEDAKLTNAANLTNEKQLNSICHWICDL
ncbi:MAG: restriction endonuclease [Elusimicrobia bacterium]|nr:restriction endonuclease [Elusimicrobiota bacterium]